MLLLTMVGLQVGTLNYYNDMGMPTEEDEIFYYL